MKAILEQLHVENRQTISAFRYQKKDFETPWHFHPQHELTYIVESTGTKFIGDYVGAYAPGELVLLRSNLPHCWKNHVEQSALAHSIVVQWNQAVFANVPELHAVHALLRKASRGLQFDKDAVKMVLPILEELPLLTGQEIYLRLLTLLIELTAFAGSPLSENSFREKLPTEHSTRISRIHDFVETQFQRKIYLREIAQLLNMSEQSFSRFFSKMMGRPFFTFLNEYRVNIASRMLIDTDRSVAEIGFACGYESLPFFHKQFNKFKKVSPARYRKQFRDFSKKA